MPVNISVQACLLFALLAPLAPGQSSSSSLPAQPLGSDDLVSLTVANSPELSHSFRVAPDGLLHLPFINDPVQARGRLPQQVEDDIRAALKAQRYFVNPTVTLGVVEYSSRPITVMGAVRRPLTFQATGQITLLDALAKAEGLAAEAGAIIYITRPKPAGTETETVSVPVRQLMDQPELVSNLRLFGGEQVRVPEAPRVYVLGNVRKPCFVPIKDPAETTILKVLTQAEGLLAYTSPEAVIYRRGTDGTEEHVVDLRNILKGKSPDLRLQAYDVLYIPESRGKRLAVGVIDRIVGFGSSTASGYLVYRR